MRLAGLRALECQGRKFGFYLGSYGNSEDFRRDYEREDRSDLCFRKKTKGRGEDTLKMRNLCPGDQLGGRKGDHRQDQTLN